MGSRMLTLLYPLFLSFLAPQVATAPNFWSQLWSLRDQQDQRALRTKAFTWTPEPDALNTGAGLDDPAVPTSATGSGEVAQFARAGEGLSDAQPDFDDFFHHRAEEEEDDRIEEEESLARRKDNPTVSQYSRGVDPTTGFRRGEEPLRRDYEFLRQWENRQRRGRSFDERRDDSSIASNSKYGEGSNYYRGGGRD